MGLLRRYDVRTGALGFAAGVVCGGIWGGSLGAAAMVVVYGAAVGFSRPYPRATWIFAATLLLAVSAQGHVPGDDAFATYPILAGHAFCAGRFDAWRGGRPAVVALLVAGEASAIVAHDAVVPFVFIPVTGWAAGRAVRERELVGRQLAERARELEEEREAYAALSVRYERARIASDLHDIVAHAISVMVVQAIAGQRLAARDPQATSETFEAIAGAAHQAEQDMQRLVALLGDEDAIGPAPDLALVEELVARAAGSGLDVRLQLEGEREGLPAEVGETAYHVVQEGLTNALRHAAGASVVVLVRGDRDGLLVEVTNPPADGDRPLAGAGTGTGLQGLRDRVAASGGALDAGPTADGGWRLSARLARRVTAGAS